MVVAGRGRRVVVVAPSVVVGRRVVVVGAGTSEVTIEVTVTVRVSGGDSPALPTAAPTRKLATPMTQPRRHQGGLAPGGAGGLAPLPPGGGCPHPSLAGGIGSVGRSISTPGVPCCRTRILLKRTILVKARYAATTDRCSARHDP